MTSRKTYVVVALLVGLGATAAPNAAALNTCQTARAVLDLALIDTDYVWVSSNHDPLAANVLLACGLPPGGLDPLPPLLYLASPILARDCGLLDPAVGTHPAALIEIAYQITAPIAPVNQRENDTGPATATYDPTTNSTTYSVRGAKWGLDAANARQGVPGQGTVYLYGVPIPATFPLGGANARAGCTEDTIGQMCWASGEATIFLTVHATIRVTSRFNAC